ncbi:hypothetical protein [Microbacterium sp. SA39]|uniref:hypothetical protein n=1 Tax=Microbacterium sp. SA39 TaxID=1263625 RepID=UPI0005FA24CA|nr:hypothetical protein [Microbacterium sp. SA39]KJQ54801.1 hypothetical protein RS85_01536 [Microbacterium sp. SA39]
MKRIITSFGAFRTGDDIADAVSRYALMLAKRHDTDVVDIPFVEEDGTEQRIELRIGWLVDIGLVADPPERWEMQEPTTVEDLNARIAILERDHAFSAAWTRSWSFWEHEI